MTLQMIKPAKMGLITKPYGFNGKRFVVCALSFFKLGKDNQLLTENLQWTKINEYLTAGLLLDLGYAKPCGEMLAAGKAFAPDGKALRKMKVSVSIGKVNKQLKVIGDRTWDNSLFGSVSKTEPFTQMPLGYPQAYGGVGHRENPLGKGVINKNQKDPETGLYALPNVYQKSASEAPNRGYQVAASFEPLDVTWPQRSRFQGTYDENWLKNVHPGFPDDTDPKLFNAATTDQQIKGYFKPGDSYQIKGMHPTLPVIEGQLPAVIARAFVYQRVDGKKQFKEIKTVIDTVWFFPEFELGIAIHRGTLAVGDSDGLDIKQLILAYEGVDDKPRAQDYFEKVLNLRINPATGPAHMLNESQLMPQKSATQVAQVEALFAQAKAQQIQKNQQQFEAQLEWIKSENPSLDDLPAFEMPDFGEDMGDFPPLPQALIDSGEIDLSPYVEKAQERIAAAQAKADEILAEQLEKAKVHAGKVTVEVESVDSMQRRVKEVLHVVATDLVDVVDILVPGWAAYASLDADTLEQIKQAEYDKAKLGRQARQIAPVNTISKQLPDKGAAQLRQWAIGLLDGGVSLAGRDFAGADLSGIDFSGLDLRELMLEGADLTGSNFSGCKLDGAVLVEANLHYANFTDCSMVQTNLALVHAKETPFIRADLTKAVFTQGRFICCDLSDTRFDKVQAIEVDFSHSTLQRLQCEGAQFVKVNFEHSDCSEASISNTVLLQTQMSGANWQKVTLSRVLMLQTTAKGANFCGAVADKVQFSNEGDFRQANFSAGQWHTCGFRGLDLNGCDASATVFQQCDFGETRLTNAKLSGVLFDSCVMALAVLDGSDCQEILFYQARMRKSKLNQVDLTHGEFYNCDLSEAVFNECKTTGLKQQPQLEKG